MKLWQKEWTDTIEVQTNSNYCFSSEITGTDNDKSIAIVVQLCEIQLSIGIGVLSQARFGIIQRIRQAQLSISIFERKLRSPNLPDQQTASQARDSGPQLCNDIIVPAQSWQSLCRWRRVNGLRLPVAVCYIQLRHVRHENNVTQVRRYLLSMDRDFLSNTAWSCTCPNRSTS